LFYYNCYRTIKQERVFGERFRNVLLTDGDCFMNVIVFLICFLASCIGSICGIGGGVIIKPVLDAVSVMDVSAISFLSGCTVLAMTTYSLIKKKVSGQSHINQKVSLPLALGAAAGGILGKQIFSVMTAAANDLNRVGRVQSICLLLVTAGTLIYNLFQFRVHTKNVDSAAACVVIGLLLGVMSSFLGIGGGPVNLVVLFFFFSMDIGSAAENSIYIIFFSQAASLLYSMATGSVPEFPWGMLVLMVAGGIVGGIAGAATMKTISLKRINNLFVGLMGVIIVICIYNVCNYSVA